MSQPSFALDLDGVIWNGADPIEGSAGAVVALRSAGHDVVFVTNNSFATISEQEAKLASFGIDAEGSVINSSQAAASLVEPGERILVLGGPGVIEAMEERGAEVVPFDGLEAGVDAVVAAEIATVVVGLDWNLSYQRLSAAVQAILTGSRFVATNTDVTYPSERGLLPGAGSVVAAIATSTRREPLVAGKPEQPAADLVRARYGANGVMVGDRPETDGAFAMALGYDFALVLSGVTADPAGVEPEPVHVAATLAELVERLL